MPELPGAEAALLMLELPRAVAQCCGQCARELPQIDRDLSARARAHGIMLHWQCAACMQTAKPAF
jgi:hypothetical protein